MDRRVGRHLAIEALVRRQTYQTREQAKADIFDYIERFYNRKRSHGYLGYLTPVEYENRVMRT